jgi:hypothetical protein
MDLDVEAVGRAEASIDAFINSRSKAKERANEEEALWKASERRVQQKRREANRQEWLRFYERMNHLHLGLAAEHADRRSRLLAECGYEPDEGPDGEAA